MKFILAKKIEMTQRYAADGRVVPVTLVHAGPCVVTQIKSPEQDGYRAVQVGFETSKHVAKPQKGHFKDTGSFRFVREFRVADDMVIEPGAKIDASIFVAGDKIQVIGVSKGHGFQGVVKRHGFHGSPASHGHKDQLRMPGSIGSKRQGPVQKGKRMAGRMGGERVTVKNLEVIDVNPETQTMAIKGAVPGARGALLLIQTV